MLNPADLPACDLQKLVEAHIVSINKVLERGVDSFAPTLLIESIDPLDDPKPRLDIAVMVDIDMSDSEAKHEAMESLGHKFFEEQHVPIGIAFASEAWLSGQLHTQPRFADDRKEVLVISALAMKDHVPPLMEFMEIKRNKDNHILIAPFIRRSDGVPESPLLESFYKGFFAPVLHKQRQ